MTITIGSRELKTRLGTYLRQVREGATVLVTDRGRPVAELRPVPPAVTDDEARLAELAAAGLVTPRVRKTWTAQKNPVRIPGPPISQTVIEDREDRF